MDPNFETLVPFVVTGVIIRSIFTAGDAYAGRRIRPPPFFIADDNSDAIPRGLLIRVLADFLSAVRFEYELSTTSGTEFARANDTPTFDDIRTMLLSAARAHGWAGPEIIVTDALSSLGPLRQFDAGIITQEEFMYVRRLVCHVLVGVLYSHSDSPFSPGVLQNISRHFAGTGHLPFNLPPLHPFGDSNGVIHSFISSLITATAPLVVSLIRHVDNGNPEINRALNGLTPNPTLWTQYTQPGNSFSVEDIIHVVHQDLTPVHITVVNPAPRPSAFIIGILVFLNIRIWFDDNTMDVGIEAGIGGFVLRDGEAEYLAALFVVALIRFHVSPDSDIPHHTG